MVSSHKIILLKVITLISFSIDLQWTVWFPIRSIKTVLYIKCYVKIIYNFQVTLYNQLQPFYLNKHCNCFFFLFSEAGPFTFLNTVSPSVRNSKKM